MRCPCCGLVYRDPWGEGCGRRCFVDPHRILQGWVYCSQDFTDMDIRRWAAMFADWTLV